MATYLTSGFLCSIHVKWNINLAKLNEISKILVLSRWLLSTVISIHVIYSPETQ